MNIASKLQVIYDKIHSIFVDCNSILMEKGATESATLSEIPAKINSLNIAKEPYIEETYNSDGLLTSAKFHGSYSTIRSYLFYCTALTSITIPDSVTSIGEDAFNGCDQLSSINIPEGIITLSDGLFAGCTALTSITIPDSVTSIGNSTFAYCTSLSSIILPSNVNSIGSRCFEGCMSLTSINILGSISNIREGAFAVSGIENFNCNLNNATLESNLFNSSNVSNINLSGTINIIKTDAFSFCDYLTSIVFDCTIQKIEGAIIDADSSINTITFKKSVQSINNLALSSNYSFTINVPWAEGAVSGAPWGAANATINYNYTGE